MNQNGFILAAESFTGLQRILRRPTHVQPGDDVKDFISHLN
jgi:hypothetical protein